MWKLVTHPTNRDKLHFGHFLGHVEAMGHQLFRSYDAVHQAPGHGFLCTQEPTCGTAMATHHLGINIRYGKAHLWIHDLQKYEKYVEMLSAEWRRFRIEKESINMAVAKPWHLLVLQVTSQKNTVTHIYEYVWQDFGCAFFYVRHVTNAPVKCNSLARLVPMVRANFWLKPQAGAIPGRYVLEWFSTQDASGTWRLDKFADTSSKKLRAENGTWNSKLGKYFFFRFHVSFREYDAP